MGLDYKATMRQNEREEQQRNIKTLAANVSSLKQQDVQIVNGRRCVYKIWVYPDGEFSLTNFCLLNFVF